MLRRNTDGRQVRGTRRKLWLSSTRLGISLRLEDDLVSQHTHAMCGYDTDSPGERDQYLDPPVFCEEDIAIIRHTVMP